MTASDTAEAGRYEPEPYRAWKRARNVRRAIVRLLLVAAAILVAANVLRILTI